MSCTRPADLKLDVVGRDVAEVLAALQRVRQEIDVLFVGVRGARGEHVEERVDARDRIAVVGRIGSAHSSQSGGGGR